MLEELLYIYTNELFFLLCDSGYFEHLKVVLYNNLNQNELVSISYDI